MDWFLYDKSLRHERVKDIMRLRIVYVNCKTYVTQLYETKKNNKFVTILYILTPHNYTIAVSGERIAPVSKSLLP